MGAVLQSPAMRGRQGIAGMEGVRIVASRCLPAVELFTSLSPAFALLRSRKTAFAARIGITCRKHFIPPNLAGALPDDYSPVRFGRNANYKRQRRHSMPSMFSIVLHPDYILVRCGGAGKGGKISAGCGGKPIMRMKGWCRADLRHGRESAV